MLVLTRKLSESLLVGADIEVQVLGIQGDRVKLGIVAPKNMNVLRKEIKERIEQEGGEVRMDK